MICNPSQTNCFFHDCSECTGPTDLENTVKAIFTDEAIRNITFKQWILTDRCELVTTVKSTEKFTESSFEKLLLLLHHSFIATYQNILLKELNCKLQSSKFVVFCDFTENSFILLDEAQQPHWNYAQATIHPFVTYFKKTDTLNTQHENLAMI
jgi:hypothetical protein